MEVAFVKSCIKGVKPHEKKWKKRYLKRSKLEWVKSRTKNTRVHKKCKNRDIKRSGNCIHKKPNEKK